MLVSPNPLNYFEGKGNLYFTPTGGVERHVGNCPSFVTTPVFETREHFSSMEGIRAVDREVTVQAGLNFAIDLEEITIDNLALFYFGEVETNSDGNLQFGILDITTITGALRFTGANTIGARYEVVIPSVSMIPSGDFDWISDDWARCQLTGKSLITGGVFGTVERLADGA